MFGRLASRGHDVDLLVSNWRAGKRREVVDGMGVHRVGGRYTFSLVAPRYYRSELSTAGYDVVVEDLNKVPLFTPLWCTQRIVLLVHHLFGRTAFEEASFPVAAATWLLEKPLPRFYHDLPVQAVSQSTADDLVARGFDRSRMTIIPNGVDTEFYSPDASVARFPEPTVLYLGRLKKYKRIDLIIRAVGLLRDRGIVANLIIAGKGDAEPELRALVQELQLNEQVRFPGFVSDEEKRTLFRRVWVHALTSPKEGWGITNLEAAACATPTVASDSPGLRDSVRDGETGFLVPHGDVVQLANRLGQLIQDERLRTELGQRALEFASGLTWERAADLTEQHLLALAS